MKGRITKQCIRVCALFLSLVLFMLSVSPAYATKNVDKLEDEASGLKSELSDLEKELKALDKELNQILSQIKTTKSELKKVREELAIAKGQEQAQYESMMTRIKYMYENGSTTMLEMLFSSKCMAEFVSKAEYFSAITDYDRKLLKEYNENREEIAKNEAKLTDTQEYLNSLQKELTSKEKALSNKISATSAELTAYTAKIEKAKDEAKKAEEESKKPINPVAPEKPEKNPAFNKAPAATNGDAVIYTEEDVVLLAALIECEAGSSNYDALLAVGAVVVNRMKHRNYPDTVYGVINQPYQFPPATNGKVDKILERGTKDLCETAARDALNGKTNVEDCISFRSASSGRPGVIIGDNVFFF